MDFRGRRNNGTTDTKIINVAGSGNGVGTTHFCISLATKLTAMGYKVGILEDHNSPHFQNIADVLGVDSRYGNFTYRGIEYYRFTRPRPMTLIKQKGFDFVVVDHGFYKEMDRDFFHVGIKQIIVASSRQWNIEDLFDNVFSISGEEVEQYHYVFPFVKNNVSLQREITKALGEIKNVYFSEVNENVFEDTNLSLVPAILGIKNEEVTQAKAPFKGRLFGKGKSTTQMAFSDEQEDSSETYYENMLQGNGLTISEIQNAVDDVMQEEIIRQAPIESTPWGTPARPNTAPPKPQYRPEPPKPQPQQQQQEEPEHVYEEPRKVVPAKKSLIKLPQTEEISQEIFKAAKKAYKFHTKEDEFFQDEYVADLLKKQVHCASAMLIRSEVCFEEKGDAIALDGWTAAKSELLNILGKDNELLAKGDMSRE